MVSTPLHRHVLTCSQAEAFMLKYNADVATAALAAGTASAEEVLLPPKQKSEERINTNGTDKLALQTPSP